GYDSESGEFVGAKWGKYLRAPEIFFKILQKCKDKLVPLKEIASVRFGIKTGANEFFYLTEEEINQKGIEDEFWMQQDRNGKWIPNYIIKNPRECKSISITKDSFDYRVLMIHKSKKELKRTKVLNYIEQGESRGFDKRPTCAGREPWYDLGIQEPADGIWFKAFNDRFLAPQNLERIFSSDRFYGIYLKNKLLKKQLFLYLNSSLPVLFVELFGRVNLGEGALDNMTYEAAAMPVLDVRIVEVQSGRFFKNFLTRPIGTIFEELGAYSKEEVNLEKVKTDRREIDKMIMGDILGLTEAEQVEVYQAVIDLVRSRLDKANSFGNKKKSKAGYQLDEVRGKIVNIIKDGL
ncbi:hypothetical protein L0Z72_11415, partial [candidate division KSB1 bacterium]|nr:hypothetical protein [candidate division KSB1 bacterium]